MDESKYAIIFDTNVIRSSQAEEANPLSTTAINSVIEFKKQNQLKEELMICIPEMVIDELIHQKMEPYSVAFDNIVKNDEKFRKRFGLSGVNFAIYKEYDYDSFFRSKMDQFIKQNDLIVIPNADVNSKKYIKRAIDKNPPFIQGRGDNGFKDTVIWLSIIEFAKKYPLYNILFITEDDIFKSQDILNEFKNEIGKLIKIEKNSIEGINHLSIGLKVDEKRKERINEIKETIIKNGISLILHRLNREGYTLYSRGVESFQLENVEFKDFQENNNVYYVFSEWKFIATLTNFYPVYPNSQSALVTVKIKLRYKKEKNDLSIISLEPKYPLCKVEPIKMHVLHNQISSMPIVNLKLLPNYTAGLDIIRDSTKSTSKAIDSSGLRRSFVDEFNKKLK